MQLLHGITAINQQVCAGCASCAFTDKLQQRHSDLFWLSKPTGLKKAFEARIKINNN